MDFGFLKIGAFSPRTCVANPKQNAIYTLDALRHAQEEGVQVAVLPELCLSGYTCGDLFGQDVLLDSCEQALLGLAEQTKGFSTVIVIGIPLRVDGPFCTVVKSSALYQRLTCRITRNFAKSGGLSRQSRQRRKRSALQERIFRLETCFFA